MKSIFKKTLCSIMLFCLLFLCVGVVTKVSAADVSAYLIDFTAKSSKNSEYTKSWTYGDTTISGAANNNGGWNYIRVGGKQKTNYTSKITSIVIEKEINKIVMSSLNTGNNKSYKLTSITLTVVNDSKTLDVVVIDSPTTEITFVPSESSIWSSNSNYEFAFLWTNTTRSNYGMDVQKIEFFTPDTSSVERFNVTFNSNGGTDVEGQIVETGKCAISPIAPTKPYYVFGGWYLDEKCTNKFDFNTPITSNIELYANWLQASYYPLIELKTNASLYVEWNTTVTTMPNVKYELVTNAEGLVAGDKLIIANITKGVLANDTINKSVLGVTNVSFNGEELPNSTNVEGVFTLGGKSGAWTLANSEGKLLGATAAKKLAWDQGTTTWSISFSGNDATIQNSTSSYGRILYNAGSPRFTTYTSSANENMLLPQIYKVVNDPSSTIEVTNYEVTSLAMRFGMMIEKDLYDAIVADNIKFGVALVKGSKFDESKATFVECEPVRVNSDGVEDANGEYYQFAAVITDIPEADRTTNVVAKVYVYNSEDKTVLGYAQEKSMSVQTLAAAYGNYEGYEGILAYLKR